MTHLAKALLVAPLFLFALGCQVVAPGSVSYGGECTAAQDCESPLICDTSGRCANDPTDERDGGSSVVEDGGVGEPDVGSPDGGVDIDGGADIDGGDFADEHGGPDDPTDVTLPFAERMVINGFETDWDYDCVRFTTAMAGAIDVAVASITDPTENACNSLFAASLYGDYARSLSDLIYFESSSFDGDVHVCPRFRFIRPAGEFLVCVQINSFGAFLGDFTEVDLDITFTPGLESGACSAGGIVTRQEEVSYFADCTSIDDDLVVLPGFGFDVSDLSALGGLTQIDGRLAITNTSGLTNLTGLDDLSSVGTDLDLQFNSNLANLNALAGVTTIGGDLNVAANSGLVTLDGISGNAVLGGIDVNQNSALTDIASVGSATALSSLALRSNPMLASASFPSLTTVDQGVFVAFNDVLSTLELGSLTSVGTSFDVSNNATLPQCLVDALLTQVDPNASLSFVDVADNDPNGTCD